MYGRIIQTVGIIGVLVAIEMQVWQQQEVWMILTTLGSLVFAVGTKVIYFSRKR